MFCFCDGSPLSFDSSVLDNLGFFDFESLFPWDDSWRHLPGPSRFSLKGWFSGTVSTCWLEELQLYVKSHGRRAEVCSCTPTTQVAVVCLVVVGRRGGGRGDNPFTAQTLAGRGAVTLSAFVWTLCPCVFVTHATSCPFAVQYTKVKFSH